MRKSIWGLLSVLWAAAALAASAGVCCAQSSYEDNPRLEQLLPDWLQQNLDVNAWGWGSYLHDSGSDYKDYWEADFATGGTLRIGDRIAATADIHFLDDDDGPRGFLEQAYVTANVFPSVGTLATVGKFNADIGLEGRNAWDRLGGTASLLFGAMPQDLIGAELTQPLGESGITLRPFIANDFEGELNSNGPPSAGATIEYKPAHGVDMAVTNWVGPGFVVGPYEYTGYTYSNWTGPEIDEKAIHGTLYLAEGHVTWHSTFGLSLGAEGLIAENGPRANKPGWSGFMFVGNYDINDQIRVFARYSYLNDNQWLVTGETQSMHEESGGMAVEFLPGAELRAEYRHDNSNDTGNIDSFSVHLVFSY